MTDTKDEINQRLSDADPRFKSPTTEQRIEKLEADLAAIKQILDVHFGAEIPE